MLSIFSYLSYDCCDDLSTIIIWLIIWYYNLNVYNMKQYKGIKVKVIKN